MLESRLFSLARYSTMVSNKCLFALFAHEMRFTARYLVRSDDMTPAWYYMSLTCAQELLLEQHLADKLQEQQLLRTK